MRLNERQQVSSQATSHDRGSASDNPVKAVCCVQSPIKATVEFTLTAQSGTFPLFCFASQEGKTSFSLFSYCECL